MRTPTTSKHKPVFGTQTASLVSVFTFRLLATSICSAGRAAFSKSRILHSDGLMLSCFCRNVAKRLPVSFQTPSGSTLIETTILPFLLLYALAMAPTRLLRLNAIGYVLTLTSTTAISAFSGNKSLLILQIDMQKNTCRKKMWIKVRSLMFSLSRVEVREYVSSSNKRWVSGSSKA
ncbi:hypothetical protein BJ878DRAFT_505045 [Calycina marina]|uniref:Uncharacterized protein n=1 Tax=Calycina marina TaxID=1763456 RepID=A0A9P8CFG6_9HELO|nr:hypothetical protein BJ878DRAFT_505045 [Calycina marina]